MLFGLKSVVLRTPFFSVFKLKKVRLKEGLETLPRLFSLLPVVQLLGGCIPERNTKTCLGENFIFVWVRQSPCKKTKSHNIMGPWLLKKHKKKKKFPPCHASFRRMRCVTLLWSRACLTRFWLAKCPTAIDPHVKQRSGAILVNDWAGHHQ